MGKFPKTRILVVEDEPSLQKTVRQHLARRGFDVEAANDSQAAIELLKRSVPDIVCLDLHLPRESGYEVCETIRNELKLDVRIVLMGAGSSPEERAYAEEAGADRYLTKPFTMNQLDEEVDYLLDLPSKTAQRA